MSVTERVRGLSSRLSRAEATRGLLEQQVGRLTADLAAADVATVEWEAGRDAVVKALLRTQADVKAFVEAVVTEALAAIYGVDCSFELEYAQQRNQMEATPWVVIGGQRFSTRDELGGGVLDVASLALRLAVWALTTPRPSSTFLLDEPSKFLSADLQPAFGRMLSELAGLLDAQFIVVTHSPQVAEAAESGYNVSKSAGVSKAERITR